MQDFAGGRIDNCNGLAAVINEHFVASLVNLTHADIDSSTEPSIQVAEIRIAQTVCLSVFVFFPEDLQSDAVFSVFKVDCFPVRHWAPRRNSGRLEQSVFKIAFAYRFCNFKCDASIFGSGDVFLNGRATYFHDTGYGTGA